jgi:hypothetical protein
MELLVSTPVVAGQTARKFAIDYHALRLAEPRFGRSPGHLCGGRWSEQRSARGVRRGRVLGLLDHYRIIRGALYKGLSEAF